MPSWLDRCTCGERGEVCGSCQARIERAQLERDDPDDGVDGVPAGLDWNWPGGRYPGA